MFDDKLLLWLWLFSFMLVVVVVLLLLVELAVRALEEVVVSCLLCSLFF